MAEAPIYFIMPRGCAARSAPWRLTTYAVLVILLMAGYFPARRAAWHINGELHTLLEVSATLLGLTAGAMALVRYYTRKTGTYLLIGCAFLAAALLDGYHAVITSSFLAGYISGTHTALTAWSG